MDCPTPVTPIPFSDLRQLTARVLDDLERCWQDVVAHGRFIGGPEVATFEARFADYCGAAHCVGVANGADATEVILAALGIGRGDEVIVPANILVTTAEAVCAVGARPRFVDVRPDTLEIDPDAVSAAVGPRTAAVMAVHLFGQMADVDRLVPLVRRYDLALIEDAAHAPGARFGGRRAGSVGVAAAFSFGPGKNLGALAEAGAVVSQDAALAVRIRQLAEHGRGRNGRFLHKGRGRNSRLDTIQAALLTAQLDRLDEDNARRRALVERYRERLPVWCVPLAQHPLSEPVHHRAVVQVPDRLAATSALDAARVGWGLHYPVPCHRKPAFAAFADGPLPEAERAAGHSLSLPLFPTLAMDQVDHVSEVLSELGGRMPLRGTPSQVSTRRLTHRDGPSGIRGERRAAR